MAVRQAFEGQQHEKVGGIEAGIPSGIAAYQRAGVQVALDERGNVATGQFSIDFVAECTRFQWQGQARKYPPLAGPRVQAAHQLRDPSGQGAAIG